MISLRYAEGLGPQQASATLANVLARLRILDSDFGFSGRKFHPVACVHAVTEIKSRLKAQFSITMHVLIVMC